jgi:hypothetical protein
LHTKVAREIGRRKILVAKEGGQEGKSKERTNSELV